MVKKNKIEWKKVYLSFVRVYFRKFHRKRRHPFVLIEVRPSC